MQFLQYLGDAIDAIARRLSQTELMETGKEVVLKQYGLHVIIVKFSDYNIPNEALAYGSLDANMFQHIS